MKNTLPDRVTPREREVLVLLCQGKTGLEIANLFGINEHSVRLHVGSLMKKFDVPNRKLLVLHALFGGVPSLNFIEKVVDHAIERRRKGGE